MDSPNWASQFIALCAEPPDSYHIRTAPAKLLGRSQKDDVRWIPWGRGLERLGQICIMTGAYYSTSFEEYLLPTVKGKTGKDRYRAKVKLTITVTGPNGEIISHQGIGENGLGGSVSQVDAEKSAKSNAVKTALAMFLINLALWGGDIDPEYSPEELPHETSQRVRETMSRPEPESNVEPERNTERNVEREVLPNVERNALAKPQVRMMTDEEVTPELMGKADQAHEFANSAFMGIQELFAGPNEVENADAFTTSLGSGCTVGEAYKEAAAGNSFELLYPASSNVFAKYRDSIYSEYMEDLPQAARKMYPGLLAHMFLSDLNEGVDKCSKRTLEDYHAAAMTAICRRFTIPV
jgi:hypothetical protein